MGRGGRFLCHRTQVAPASHAERARRASNEAGAVMPVMINHGGTPREQAFRITPGKLFRMITEPTKPDLLSPFQCLKYAALLGECPERQRGRTVNPLA